MLSEVAVTIVCVPPFLTSANVLRKELNRAWARGKEEEVKIMQTDVLFRISRAFLYPTDQKEEQSLFGCGH